MHISSGILDEHAGACISNAAFVFTHSLKVHPCACAASAHTLMLCLLKYAVPSLHYLVSFLVNVPIAASLMFFFPAFFSHQGPHLALLSHLCSELINAMSFMLAANKLLLHCLHPAVVLSRVYCHCPYHSSGKEPGAAFTFPTHHTHAHHTHDKADNDNACHVFHWHHSGMVL